MNLNLACGHNKIPGCINIDKYVDGADVKADVVCLPFADASVDTVYLFHTIEHFEEQKQITLLRHIWDKLKEDGRLIITYPEFIECAKRYIDNFKGMREFFKWTVYGRQTNPGDYHVSLMDSRFFCNLLTLLGYKDVEKSVEKNEEWNSVVKCRKGKKPPTQEELYRKLIWEM